MKRLVSILVLALLLSSSATTLLSNQDTTQAAPVSDSYCWPTSTGPAYVPETGHHIYEPFLSVWRQYDLAILGFPVSEPLEIDGMTVQYFERARFEHHLEHEGTDYEVLFTLLGRWVASEREDPAFAQVEPDSSQPDPSARYYPETGHYLQAPFLDYWDTYGGLPVFGYPISETLQENGYLVQYFERARFEHHPENLGTRYEVLLGHLGRELADADSIDQSAAPKGENAVDYRQSAEPSSYRIPALLYHHIDAPASRFQVTPWDFEQQLIWLLDHGYSAVTISQAYDGIFGGADLPAHPVMITLDDSFPDQWQAAEILERHGMRGVFFIVPGQGLTPDQVRQLRQRGHDIGSHAYTHPDLKQVSDAQLWHEIAGSREELSAIIGEPVDFFAYPRGEWDSRVVDVVREAGYCGAVQAWGGQEWTPETRWHQPRVEISGELTLAEIANLIGTPAN